MSESPSRARALTGAFRTLLRRARNKPRQTLELVVPFEHLGSDYAGYAVAPQGLGPNSVVYSFGVGEDASFDLALIERFGLTVHAFDPTPKSIAWVERQDLGERFVFHPLGVAGYDGVARFNPPVNSEHVSHTLLDRAATADRAIEVPVLRVRTLMQRLGHQHIDLLKMDIEGAEYAVIEDLLEGGPYPQQILLEYHQQLQGVSLSQTERSLELLRAHGYRIFHESTRGREFSLLRV